MTPVNHHAQSAIDEFITRWQASGGSERANYGQFLTELCELLDVPKPQPTTTDNAHNAYVFERDVTFTAPDGSTSIGRIDLYKRGCFVLEAKQGSDQQREEERAEQALVVTKKKTAKKKGTAVRGTRAWDDAMVRARGQAESYAKALPTTEGWPPFIMVVDVGHSIELYSEFTRQGRAYVPFPDPQSHRLKLDDLRDEKIRDRLRAVWLDPLSLDPSRRSAKVTRDLASKLAELAKLLEKANHDPALVAKFLMRCLFTMFAEDVDLIPRGAFHALLESLADEPQNFLPMMEDLWQTMNAGGFSPILRKHVLRFNGGLFSDSTALPLTKPMLALLIAASKADWADVEPAIFGTLLERALDPIERHKLGAHYTPRAYVERLVMPTIIEPLRDEWNTVFASAVAHASEGELEEAQKEVLEFHEHLRDVRVLDPACGSGNFLYVALEHIKRLEGEVLNALKEFGYKQTLLLEVDPHQFLGIEINPRAAAIADLVLWIGYLQWHFRTRGKTQPAEPIIKNYQNIECRDAVLAWDRTEPLLDEQGEPVTRWDGRTTKRHPVTGEQVPDDTARVPVLKYINPRKAEWPKADYVVGNPPFIGTRRMRLIIGHGYVDALADAYANVPDTADYVMYWWHYASELLRDARILRFGLITTNSIHQTFNRAVVRSLTISSNASIVFAIPDHPWVEASDGAAVRVAMSVCASPKQPGTLLRTETERDEDVVFQPSLFGPITEDLRIGASPANTVVLNSNDRISYWGVKFYGDGFIIDSQAFEELNGEKSGGPLIRQFISGRDLTGVDRKLLAIDCDGLTEAELQSRFPRAYQHLLVHVKPVRLHNPRPLKRDRWWIFGENQPGMRRAVAQIERYIATTETAKHRFFQFFKNEILAEGTVAVIALEDGASLGILSSRIHVSWALAAGGRLGVGNDPRYNKTRCFDTFPFPVCNETQQARIRELGEQLDAHRKRQQALHPKLTLTDMYNVLEKLRAGETLSDKERAIHDAGLVSVLRQIHDDLDAAVFDAYGWPTTLTDEEILERLVALNAERAAEEARGLVRWLRPEFQNPSGAGKAGATAGLPSSARQASLELADEPEPVPAKPGKKTAVAKQPWPAQQAERTRVVQQALATAGKPVTAAELAKTFARAQSAQVEKILDALTSLGLARRTRGKYTV